ncbi:MAG: DUF3795 domain-containing protein [Candidatus Hodarchaeota archaeon]
MDQTIGFCGVYCIECPAFIAKLENDHELREQVSRSWFRNGFRFKPDEINYDGYHSDGELLAFCASCKVRNCALEKEFDTCADCDMYPCVDKLEYQWKQINDPQTKKTLDQLRT